MYVIKDPIVLTLCQPNKRRIICIYETERGKWWPIMTSVAKSKVKYCWHREPRSRTSSSPIVKLAGGGCSHRWERDTNVGLQNLNMCNFGKQNYENTVSDFCIVT